MKNIFNNIKSKQTCSELPRVVPVLRWVLFAGQISVSPHLEFEKHMKRSDPSPQSFLFMQSERRRAAPQASQPPSKASARTFHSTTRRPRNENSLHFRITHIFFFHFLLLPLQTRKLSANLWHSYYE